MNKQPHFYYFAEIDSTQRYLLDHPHTASPIICLSKQQTAGYGQRGATWQSPQGGLYFSLRYQFPYPSEIQNGLAQMLALTIAETLDNAAKTIKLKWPNDLFINDKKLGGILVENQPYEEGCVSIIGIGINLNGSDNNIAYYNEHFTTQTADTLLKKLTPPLLQTLARWAQTPYLPLTHRWNDYDRFYRQPVRLQNKSSHVENLGIDQKGRLCIRTIDGLQYLTNTRIQP